MRAAHGLHRTGQQADEQGSGQPAETDHALASRSTRRCPQPRQAQRHERKTAGRMTAWETPPGAAVGETPSPVRHMPGGATESAQVPGAAGQAGVLDQVHRQQRQAHQRHHPPAFATRQLQARPQGPDDQQQPGDGHRVAQAVVQHRREQPGVAQRKTLRRADGLHHGQVQARGVPEQGEGQQAEQPGGGAGAVHGATVSGPR